MEFADALATKSTTPERAAVGWAKARRGHRPRCDVPTISIGREARWARRARRCLLAATAQPRLCPPYRPHFHLSPIDANKPNHPLDPCRGGIDVRPQPVALL